MGLLAGFFGQFRYWDMPTRIAFILAAVMVFGMTGLAMAGIDGVSNAAWIGVASLLIVTQLIVLWGNRHMVTPFTKAQRLALAGDFAAARDELAPFIETHKNPPADAMTLLGNIYRNLGDTDKSKAILTRAVKKAPAYHFPLYGYGRTLLVSGDYSRAIPVIETALKYDAPDIVRVDLGEAQFRAGHFDAALTTLSDVPDEALTEAHRRLLTGYLLYQMKPEAFTAPDYDLIEAGLPFWEAEAARFAENVYGRHLTEDILRIRSMQAGA